MLAITPTCNKVWVFILRIFFTHPLFRVPSPHYVGVVQGWSQVRESDPLLVLRMNVILTEHLLMEPPVGYAPTLPSPLRPGVLHKLQRLKVTTRIGKDVFRVLPLHHTAITSEYLFSEHCLHTHSFECPLHIMLVWFRDGCSGRNRTFFSSVQ